jgi:hypothetical protein
MNREEVIRLTREAGAGEPESLYGRTDYVVMTWFELERFAALVAAAEREACAKVCYERERANLYGFKECAAAIRARGESK